MLVTTVDKKIKFYQRVILMISGKVCARIESMASGSVAAQL